jgi:two-component system phosphate regulon response regulator OmpR
MDNQHDKLLIVDDDKEFSELVKDYLNLNGFDVAMVYDGNTMIQYLSEHVVDLFLIDVMLPGKDGLSLAQWLRMEDYQQPIIMISSVAKEETDCVVGLEIGADDYLIKPVGFRELLARIKAVLRRHTRQLTTTGSSQFKKNQSIYTFGPFTFNTKRHCLTKKNIDISLTPAEYNLLQTFVTHPNQVMNRDRLLNLIKGYDRLPQDRSIDVVVSRLRTKIEVNSSTPNYIRTIWGEGYLFSPL